MKVSKSHLTLDQRMNLERMLLDRMSFREMAAALEKSPSTISREIRSRRICKRTGSANRQYNTCALRFHCQKSHICMVCDASRRFRLCRNCNKCNAVCRDFQKQVCSTLSKPPYVCNGCRTKFGCTLEKWFYEARQAEQDYRTILSDSRSGIACSQEELQHLDELISPLIRKKHSPHAICAANPDRIMISERTIYRYLDARYFSSMNVDLPRKVRFKTRKKSCPLKVDKRCRIGRTYRDFQSFLEAHPEIHVTELDSVEGKKGGKVLLTIHFKKAELMLAFLRDYNDAASVAAVFNRLEQQLGRERFMRIFQVCLADNGSEFSNPSAIETGTDGQKRTSLFYCDPQASYQKGSAERNHEFIRYFIPKGKDMGLYGQEEISVMMDHINSYGRKSLADKCPYDMFAFLYGKEILDLLGCHKIAPDKVTLNSNVFKSKGETNEV